MDELLDQQWTKQWGTLRSRRIGTIVATVAFVAVWIALGPLGLVVGFSMLAASYWYLRTWQCPRCHLPVVGAGFRTFVERCANCHLLLFGHPDDVLWAAPVDPARLQLSRRIRRFVAGYEMVVGVGLMILTSFVRGAWWYTLMFEGLAAMSLAAGLWLWRDDVRGYALSRTLQLAQIVRVQAPSFVYAATAGAYLDLYQTNGRVGVNPGFMGSFSLAFGGDRPFGAAVNLWATALLLVLLHARPAPALSHKPAPLSRAPL